jgi:hypothetical protein
MQKMQTNLYKVNFHCCTVHSEIYIVTHQQMHYLLNLEMFKIYTNITPMNSQTRHESRYKKKICPLTQSHSAQHTTHTPLQGKPVHIFTCLTAYLFAFYIYIPYLFLYIF